MSESKGEVKVGMGQKVVFGAIMSVVMVLYYLVFLNKALMVMQNLAYPY
ncbi:MAG: hypothetical protein VST69_01450 [Nitrospirota bacterium]|nr:hypothetical protein [Nitrospirota bacterium]